MRVDRFLSNLPQFNRQQVRLLMIEKRIQVDGQVISDPRHEINAFSRIELDENILQAGKPARYFMLHKPQGCVSATRDAEHPTVLDLLNEPDKHDLHIAGRLDFNTSGLLLITNDGHWSRHVTQPQTKMPKVYYVETEQEITDAYISKFREGVYFAFEDLTTQPAGLELLGPFSARLSIVEGRYHQVKRMFGFFDNKVMRLHRESIGPLVLDSQLAPGEYRALSEQEVLQFQPAPAS
ncbi:MULTISPECIES: pseudouridine synthase [unclassified Pseudomonas]|jgi:16S rRNA pseudouridine516 synthase|uniref:pseudouridine synthase n=1 Tax=unclassified Pseudomonas TaxID=196821 RepID=UPI0010566A85|nr:MULTISPECIES: pseudouridine synthase [unclassified Pseudomonas]MBW3506866.1 pseudouridine synthase [Pseudomonas sp. NKUCC02_KPG]MEC4166706.1 pseudouridine synthase [Pseudomonas sp. MS-1(2024)]MEC4240826.1 pseudouridine synthase [Pseudomonas sp. DSV-1]